MSEHEAASSDETARRLEMAAKILGLIYALISLMWLAWAMIPEHRKRLWAMKATAAVRQGTGTLAFRTGHKAMGLELASSVENYTLPYLLSQARDKAGEFYEKLRYVA